MASPEHGRVESFIGRLWRMLIEKKISFIFGFYQYISYAQLQLKLHITDDLVLVKSKIVNCR